MRALALGACMGVVAVAAVAAEELPAPYAEALRNLRTARAPAERAVAAIGLGHGFAGLPVVSDPAVVEALREALALDPDPTVQTMAAYALCARGDQRGVARVIEALAERQTQAVDPQGFYSDAVRLPVPYLYRALGHAGGAEATTFLIEAATGAAHAARLVAIPALGLLRNDDGRVDRALAALAADRDQAVRGVAAYVAGERLRRLSRP